jgi:hypothetical protein
MQGQSHFLDIYRSMARATNDSITASLQSTERIHQKQLEVVRSALEHSSKASRQLAEVHDVDELLAAQSQIIGAQVAQSMELWRSLFRAAGDMQMSMMSQMQHQVGQAAETVRQAYDLTKRATEDVTRVAASQVSAATTSMARETAPQQPQRKSA